MVSAADAQAALLAWSASFEAKTGRPPTDSDKSSSKEYQMLKAQYKKTVLGGKRGASKGAGQEKRRRDAHSRDDRHRNASGGHRNARSGRRDERKGRSAPNPQLTANTGSAQDADPFAGEETASSSISAFREHDANGDGTLEFDEFAAAVEQIAGSDHPVDQMHLRAAFHRLDQDQTKSMDFGEYKTIMDSMQPRGPSVHKALHSLLGDLEADGLTKEDVERAVQAFKRHDADRNGTLSPRSFTLVVDKLAQAEGHKYSERELDSLLRRADLDADGKIDFHELLKLLARQRRVLQATTLVEQRRTTQQREAEMQKARKQESAVQRAVAAAEMKAVKSSASAQDVRQRGDRNFTFPQQNAARAAPSNQAMVGTDVAYTMMLREEIDNDGVLSEYPHVPKPVVDATIQLFNKHDAKHDGRLHREDFITAMQAYGNILGNPASYKRPALERAFEIAESTGAGSLSISDFIRYLGQGGRLRVDPGAFLSAAGLDSTLASVGGGAGGSASGVTEHDEYAQRVRSELQSSGVLASMPHVHDHHISGCVEFYRAFDGDGDGYLTPREFVTALRAYGRATGDPNAYQRNRLQNAFDMNDVSSDSRLELSEFVRYIGKNGTISMDVKAMRRAATDWIALQKFEKVQHGGASGGVGKGQHVFGGTRGGPANVAAARSSQQPTGMTSDSMKRRQGERRPSLMADGGQFVGSCTGASMSYAKRAGQMAGRVVSSCAANVKDATVDHLRAIDAGGGTRLQYHEGHGGARLRDKAYDNALEGFAFMFG